MKRTTRLPRPLIALSVAFGPPAVWSVHLLICYLLVYVTGGLGDRGVRIELTGVTLVALALIGLTAFVGWRSLSAEELRERDGPLAFFDRFGVWSAVVFGLATAFTVAPVYVLERVTA